MCQRIIMIELGIFSIGTLFGILIRGFLGHALSIRRIDYQSRQDALSSLRESFQYALVELRKDANPEILACAYYDKHRDNAISYLSYLAGRKAAKFEKCLNEYTEWRKSSRNIPAESPRDSQELINILSKMLKHT